jgi:NADH-quinone oxidoreductase subunit C
MSAKLQKLSQELVAVFGDRIAQPLIAVGELTVEVPSAHYLDVARQLRDDPKFSFEQLTDLSGIDYSAFDGWSGKRFAAVSVLTSIRHNRRMRLRVFAEDDGFPVLSSVVDVWNGVNWYEREAFDLYGIHFEGHPDLRRILTDYGFVGHPFRKDFPIFGHVEMRYDADLGRVVYQPVTIEPREVTPRIVREENYGRG